jgi:hypothetical protein
MKIICIPLTSKAMHLLDTDSCPDSLLETINLTSEEYDRLLKSGAIDTINASPGKIIDEYEDEKIDTPEDLKKTLSILEARKTAANSDIINKIISLNTLAIHNHTGLFFFF